MVPIWLILHMLIFFFYSALFLARCALNLRDCRFYDIALFRVILGLSCPLLVPSPTMDLYLRTAYPIGHTGKTTISSKLNFGLTVVLQCGQQTQTLVKQCCIHGSLFSISRTRDQKVLTRGHHSTCFSLNLCVPKETEKEDMLTCWHTMN